MHTCRKVVVIEVTIKHTQCHRITAISQLLIKCHQTPVDTVTVLCRR